MDRSWMYDRFNPHKRGLKFEFVSGVQEFIKKAKEQPCFLSYRRIKCPCATCKCVKSLTPGEVKAHLYKSGFKPDYSIWTEHGEIPQNICAQSQSNNSGHMEGEKEEEDPKTPHMEESEEGKDPKSPHMEESEEEEDPKTPQEIDLHEQNSGEKVLIRPYGLGWAPSSAPAAAIKHAIQSHFQGPYYCWRETPEDVREYWWKLFGEKVTWDPHDHGYIKKTFQSRGAKRLSDMLSKVRKKGTRPHWICEEAWKALNVHWEGEAFQKISTQNKTNRASGKGGAVHTTGRKAHVDVALSLVHELGRSVDPDELFLATHKKKSGNWVDDRSQTTYKHYHDRLKEVQTQIGEASHNGVHEVDGKTKLELWKEVAGGKSRGRCYGTADLALNLRRGASSLTQESRQGRCDDAMHLEAIDAARKEAAAARQDAAAARQEAAEAKQHYQLLEEQMHKVMKHMKDLEQKSAGASRSVSPACRELPYHDDHSLDEVLPDRRRRKRQALRRHRHYYDDRSLDVILPERRRKQHQAQRRHSHYDDNDLLDEVLPKQRQAKRRHRHYDNDNLLDEILAKQHQANRRHAPYDDDSSPDEVLSNHHQAKRKNPQYDKNNSPDRVIAKQHQAKRRNSQYNIDNCPERILAKQHQSKRGHPHSNDDNSLDEVLSKQHQAKRRNSHYDGDNLLEIERILAKQHQAIRRNSHYDSDNSLERERILAKKYQAKRGHSHYNDGNSLDEVLPKKQAKRGHSRYDDGGDSLDEILPKKQAKRGHSRYDDGGDSLDEILTKKQAKRGHSRYDNGGDSLDEVLPKRQAKRGHPHYDDDNDLDEVLSTRRSRR